jgi:F-type H+-transporting ATPase subunit delta
LRKLAISRRYARALLIIAKEDGQAETYRRELDGFSELLIRETELERAIANPLYDTASRRKVLEKTLEKLNLSTVVTSFLLLLFEKGRIGFLNDINAYYQKLADELKGISRAELVSATELSTESVKKIRESLSKMTGRAVILNTTQDPSLIGGVITKIGDFVLDGSVKTQLSNMKESLKRGEQI